MTPSDIWFANNADRIIEMVADHETMEFCDAYFDRVERELFALEYDKLYRENEDLKEKLAKTLRREKRIREIVSHELNWGYIEKTLEEIEKGE